MPRRPSPTPSLATFRKILCSLAEQGPQTKYNLRKQTRLARQTIHNTIPGMKWHGWIEPETIRRTRTGKLSEQYRLTSLGWVRAVAIDSKLANRVPAQLNGIVKQHEESISHGRARDAERWGQVVKEVLGSGRAPPGWHLKIEILADKEDGRIRYHIQYGVPATKRRKREVERAFPTHSRTTSP